MSNQTPGPWKRSTRSWGGRTYWVVEDQTGAVICQAEIEFNAYDADAWINIEEENTANVTLIESAPKLLEACKSSLAELERLTEEGEGSLSLSTPRIKNEPLSLCRAAIAEAEKEKQ